MQTRVLIPSGVLGLGFSAAALADAAASRPDAIAIDGGSTDSGPYYLGTGQGKYARSTLVYEWQQLLHLREQLSVPLIIGSCGTCGSDAGVEMMFDITRDWAEANPHQPLRVALIFSEQSHDSLRAAWGRVEALAGAPEFGVDDIDQLTHCVALCGVEPIQNALREGADIVLVGRCTDTALIAALPIMRGADVASAWHGAKVTECGALCTESPPQGVVMLDVDETGFCVWAPGVRCTETSVAAHMLYENADPFRLSEPGGVLDVSTARYQRIDDAVRVEGARWEPAPYSVKLEGARLDGYQYTILALLRDPRYVREAQQWAQRLRATVDRLVQQQLGEVSYQFDVRLIGYNATLGALENGQGQPNEIGALGIITADSDELAHEIAMLSNPHFLHLALRDDEPTPSFAFPYSPAETRRGALYAFALHHRWLLSDPMEAFRLEWRSL